MPASASPSAPVPAAARSHNSGLSPRISVDHTRGFRGSSRGMWVHRSMRAVTPYHRAGHASRWRAIGELLLAALLWFVLMAIFLAIEQQIGGVKRVKELPKDAQTLTTFLNLAALGPAALIAAKICGRRAGTLWSVTERLRWRWLATCLVVALCVRAISPLFVALELVTGRKTFAGVETYAWQLPLVLAVVPLQATAEELFFRGTVMQTVGAFARSPWPAIVVSTALFTLAHGLRPELAVAIAPVGFITAWLTVRTGGLEAGVAYHVVLNVLGMAAQVAIAGGDHKGVNEHVKWSGAIVSAVFAIIYAIIVARLAKRLPPVADQVEQRAAERSMGVEHADHGSDAEALPPEQQQAGG